MSERNENIKKMRSALKALFDKKHEKSSPVFALKTKISATDCYITTASLAWIGDHVQFAADLPVFKKKSDTNSKRVNVDKDTLEFLSQRDPDWRRQLPITEYLTRENHKFPPLLVVGYQDWVYEDIPESGNWDSGGKAVKSSVPVMPLDSNVHFLDIDNKETKYYVLDGQHRLMAILGLKELLENECLPARKEDRSVKPTGNVNLDEIVKLIIRRRNNLGNNGADAKAIRNMLKGRMDKKIGIEIIPAVQGGETLKSAVSRLRQIFVDLNQNAKSPSKGDNIILDGNNGFRILARYMMVSHGLLNNDKTSKGNASLLEKSKHYTTLSELTTIAEAYLGQIPNFPYADWKFEAKRFGYIRPPEKEIGQGKKDLAVYFDALEKLPSHKRFMRASEKKREKFRAEDGDDNILFRPIAQSALAGAIGSILCTSSVSKEQIPYKLQEIIKMISEQERKGNLKLRKKAAPWYGVLCDSSGKMRRHIKYKKLCETLFIHLLHNGIRGADFKDLQKNFREAREDASKEGRRLRTNLPAPWNL